MTQHVLTGFERSERGSSRWVCSCGQTGAGRATDEHARAAWVKHASGNVAWRVEHGLIANHAELPLQPLQAGTPVCSGCGDEFGLKKCTCRRSWCSGCCVVTTMCRGCSGDVAVRVTR